jgi:hypothetical protein
VNIRQPLKSDIWSTVEMGQQTIVLKGAIHHSVAALLVNSAWENYIK